MRSLDGAYNEEDINIKLEQIENDYENEDANENKQGLSPKIDDAFSIYLKDIGKIPLLTLEQEIETAKKIKEGDKEAKQLMINSNLKLVVNIAKHYRGSGVEIMDLVQEGNQGLMVAVDRYDVDRGYRFSTYATWWIRQSITRYIMNSGRTIRLPVHAIETYNKIKGCSKELEQTLHREPTDAEIAKYLNIDEYKVMQVLNTMSDIRSLDAPISSDEGREDSTLGEFIVADNILTPEEYYDSHELHNVILDILNEKRSDGTDKFSNREKEVILLRFGFYDKVHTLDEVGKKWGVTRERIRQIESAAIRKLRLPSTASKLKPFLNK